MRFITTISSDMYNLSTKETIQIQKYLLFEHMDFKNSIDDLKLHHRQIYHLDTEDSRN